MHLKHNNNRMGNEGINKLYTYKIVTWIKEEKTTINTNFVP